MTIVRFGYVAMSVVVKDCSPSKTMTYASYSKLADEDAARRKLLQIAEMNLQNTLRLLIHSNAHDIKVYRLSSKLIPLATHQALKDWSPYEHLQPAFQKIGDFVRKHHMRISLHPDHFCVFSTPREEVLISSIMDMEYHVKMLEMMELDERCKCNIHMGGAYGDKKVAAARFVKQFSALDERLCHRVTLENDDKTFNVEETLLAAETVGVPMVLDIHHYAVNDGGITFDQLVEQYWPRIVATWEKERSRLKLSAAQLPVKIHISSPKSASDPRGHADFVDVEPVISFLLRAAKYTTHIDCMIEAKAKDQALFQLMENMRAFTSNNDQISVRDDASITITATS